MNILILSFFYTTLNCAQICIMLYKENGIATVILQYTIPTTNFKKMRQTISLLLLIIPLVLTAQIQGTFTTDGTRLLDANGNEFVMRGVNYSWCWQKGKETTVIPAAKRIGCNTIRIQLGTGKRFSKPGVRDLKKLITLCEENKLVAVFNTHDATGSDNYSDLEDAVQFWISMKDLLNEHTATTIVNIANEWFGSMNKSAQWADGYKKAIAMLRAAGLRNTLMIDAAGWGQWPKSIWEKADEVASADPLGNIIFSVHMYDVAAKNAETVRRNIDNSLATGYPIVIGEFAYQHGGRYVDWQTVLDYTAEKSVGYLVWSWTGNSGGVEDCDMFGGYDENIVKPNGQHTVYGRNGIQETAAECSVYNSASIREIVSGTLTIDFSAPYEIYNICGRKVADTGCPGIYIIRQNGTSYKYIRR